MEDLGDALGKEIIDAEKLEILQDRIKSLTEAPPATICINVVLNGTAALKHAICREIIKNAARDEHPENGQELCLGEEIGFAGFPDGVGNPGHAFMNRECLGLEILQDAESRTDKTDGDSHHEKALARHPDGIKFHRAEIRDVDVGFVCSCWKRHTGNTGHDPC
jgi:hypothetical protein